MARRSSARPGRPRERRDARRQPGPHRADRRGSARDPARADGLRQPVHRRRGWPRGRSPAGAAGASGVIVADLTPDEGGPFESVAREHDLAVVYLVAPTTPPDRRAEIAVRSGGFLYCVSLVGVTGARTSLPSTVGRLVRDVVAASPVPVGVGFGVSRPAHVRALARAGAGGVIVASALVDALGPDGTDVSGWPGSSATWPRRTTGDREADRRVDRGGAEEGVRDRRRLAGLEPIRQDRRARDRGVGGLCRAIRAGREARG